MNVLTARIELPARSSRRTAVVVERAEVTGEYGLLSARFSAGGAPRSVLIALDRDVLNRLGGVSLDGPRLHITGTSADEDRRARQVTLTFARAADAAALAGILLGSRRP